MPPLWFSNPVHVLSFCFVLIVQF